MIRPLWNDHKKSTTHNQLLNRGRQGGQLPWRGWLIIGCARLTVRSIPNPLSFRKVNLQGMYIYIYKYSEICRCASSLDSTSDFNACRIAVPGGPGGPVRGAQWLHQIIGTLEALHAVLTKRTPLPAAPWLGRSWLGTSAPCKITKSKRYIMVNHGTMNHYWIGKSLQQITGLADLRRFLGGVAHVLPQPNLVAHPDPAASTEHVLSTEASVIYLSGHVGWLESPSQEVFKKQNNQKNKDKK